MIRDIDIIKAFKEGMSISELSKKYNYSRQGIYNILQRNNINYKKDKPEINIEDIKYDLKQKKPRKALSRGKKKTRLKISRVLIFIKVCFL